MNPPNGQAPLDYLNQIAPEAPKKPMFELNLRTVIFGGVILVIFVIIISLISGSIANSRKEPWQQLSARLETTATVATDATPKIKSSQLRSLNSDLRLYLTNTRRDIAQHLAAAEVLPENIPATIIAQESGETMLANLEDGRLNAKYDTTYAREMGFQLAMLVALLNQLAQTSSGESKVFLETAHANLTPIYKGIESFDTSTE